MYECCERQIHQRHQASKGATRGGSKGVSHGLRWQWLGILIAPLRGLRRLMGSGGWTVLGEIPLKRLWVILADTGSMELRSVGGCGQMDEWLKWGVSRSQNSVDSDSVPIVSPVPTVRREKPMNQSGDSAAFSWKGQPPSLGDVSSAQAQTDTEASMQEDMEYLRSVRKQLFSGRSGCHLSGLGRNYRGTSCERTWKLSLGCAIGTACLSERSTPVCRIRSGTTVDSRVLQNKLVRQAIPEDPLSSQDQRGRALQPAESVVPERQDPGVSVLGSPGTNGATGNAGDGAVPNLASGQGRQEQERSTSPIEGPILPSDERILGRYFTRGSQGVGEEERANVLQEMEKRNLEPYNQGDQKEKWAGQDSSLPPLPLGTDDEKQQVHVQLALERWESRLILHYNTISLKAGLYIKAVLAGVAKMLPLYRKDHDPQVIRNMTCAEVKFHPMAEAHTCRFLTEMKMPPQSYDSATQIQAEPPMRIQLLMHYNRILPPPPVELKRCQEYFLNPPSHVTQPNLVCDEIMKWKGMGWRLRRLLKHYPTLNEMTKGFTTS
eukprot:2552112-Amphidinium_carterae.1